MKGTSWEPLKCSLSCSCEMLGKPRKRRKPTVETDKPPTAILEKFLTISQWFCIKNIISDVAILGA